MSHGVNGPLSCLGRDLMAALLVADKWCRRPPPLFSDGNCSLTKMALFTPFSKHRSSLAKMCTLLSSYERPLTLRCRWIAEF